MSVSPTAIHGSHPASPETGGIVLESRPTFLGGLAATLELEQREELISASLGIKAGERGTSLEPKLKADTIHVRRHDIYKVVGAESITHAVGIGIVSGIVPIELEPEDEEIPEVDTLTYQTLLLATKGLTSDAIADELDISKSTIVNYYKELMELLDAKNRPHVTRRAFETRLLLPTPELSELCLSSLTRAREILSNMEQRAII